MQKLIPNILFVVFGLLAVIVAAYYMSHWQHVESAQELTDLAMPPATRPIRSRLLPGWRPSPARHRARERETRPSPTLPGCSTKAITLASARHACAA